MIFVAISNIIMSILRFQHVLNGVHCCTLCVHSVYTLCTPCVHCRLYIHCTLYTLYQLACTLGLVFSSQYHYTTLIGVNLTRSIAPLLSSDWWIIVS